MKTLEIKIRTREQSDEAFLDVIRRIKAGEKLPTVKEPDVAFTSLEAVRALLTEKRMELLHLIKKHSPRSINQLATLAGRDFKNVHTDIMLLKEYGIVKLTRHHKAAKTVRRMISVPFEAINIHAVV